MTPLAYEDRAVRLLRRKRGCWVDGLQIAKVAGMYAWRTALSRARKKYRVQIENRIRRTRTRKISEYRIPRKRAA